MVGNAMIMDEGLAKISLGRYRFILQAEETIKLPPYKGACLRGGFGITFRKICCVNKRLKDCGFCILKEKCAYTYIFETSPPPQAQKLKKLAEIPRPFVIEPPEEKKNIYNKEEEIELNLILIGKAREYLPYFVLTFRELGKIGLGKERGKFFLSKIYDADGEKIYEAGSDCLKNYASSEKNGINVENYFSDYLILNFSTPTRIKFQRDLVTRPEFHILIRALLHRLSALAYFHCGFTLELDYNLLISQAEKIKIKKSNLNWFDWERYSTRQNTKMKLGGFVGQITYEGDFKPFLPLVALGQFTHVGKNCTFGLGKYRIVKEN
ncbi:MAG: CRISPR system precrRNA processing endoribonuclease RAMP protein Cas6 [Candidatus Omnitrophica bacterium]|nr:CRISPR system precrRNA processing endoribonuclease RAMP protein Cas6 [Candidatus Omnitrophota bacterium]MCM8793650.1 CRISPR system precrRNA processing endoribonuclease RAMP protein Cas6 [Candidatus Omnitrophota bacterium]